MAERRALPAPARAPRAPRVQRGATAVEFAIVASVFLMLVLGMTDLGRWAWGTVSAAQATQVGARMAVVCDIDDPDIRLRMEPFLAGLQKSAEGGIDIIYAPSGCSANNCTSVTVALRGYQLAPIFLPAAQLPIPAARTFLPRERLASLDNSRCG